MNRLECSAVSRWIANAKDETNDGICLVDPTQVPGGLRIVVVSNDGEPTRDRPVLDSIDAVISVPSSCISLAVRNYSLASWRIAFTGRCQCGQLWFRNADGVEKWFGIAGQFRSNESDQEQSENCHELRIDFDIETITKSHKKLATSVEGTVEVSNRLKSNDVQYRLRLKGS